MLADHLEPAVAAVRLRLVGVALAALGDQPLGAVEVVDRTGLPTGGTRRHSPLGRSSLGSLLPKASLRMLRQTALKYAAAAESESWV